MGLTVLPPSQPPRRGAPPSRACASRLRLDPASIGRYATASNAKESKRPGSCRDGEPLTKRRRVAEDAAVAATGAMSFEEKNGVNLLLLSLLSPGRAPNEVIPLPDSVVRVLQEHGTRSRGGEDDEIEIDVHSLGDDSQRVIKDRVGAYLADRAGSAEATKQNKEGVIEQSVPRSVPSKAASKSIPSNAAPKSVLSNAAPKSIPSRPALKIAPLNAAPKSIPSRPPQKSIPPRPAEMNIPSRPSRKNTPPRAVPLPPAPPKPSESRGSVSEHQETAISKSLPRNTSLIASRLLQPPPNPSPSGSKKSLKELIADAGEVMKKVVRRREIEELRAAARREVEQMVRTVEFNDPYIDYKDVFK